MSSASARCANASSRSRSSRRRSPAREFVPAEAVHLVAGETERAVFRDHGRAPLRAGSAIVGVVLDSVDLEHDPRASREQEQEVHALAYELAGPVAELGPHVRVVVEVDLRDKSGDVGSSRLRIPRAVRAEEELLGVVRE